MKGVDDAVGHGHIDEEDVAIAQFGEGGGQAGGQGDEELGPGGGVARAGQDGRLLGLGGGAFPGGLAPVGLGCPVDDGHPLGQELLAHLVGQALLELGHAARLAQPDGRLQGVEAGVREVADDPHLLDGGPVHLLDLPHQDGDEVLAGQVDCELVDGHSAAALQHVDTDDVAPHRTDAGGHLAQGAGAVRQPHPHEHVGLALAHRRQVRRSYALRACEPAVAAGRSRSCSPTSSAPPNS
jgi:hypothetical protein